jgi:hypothetical protein
VRSWWGYSDDRIIRDGTFFNYFCVSKNPPKEKPEEDFYPQMKKDLHRLWKKRDFWVCNPGDFCKKRAENSARF